MKDEEKLLVEFWKYGVLRISETESNERMSDFADEMKMPAMIAQIKK